MSGRNPSTSVITCCLLCVREEEAESEAEEPGLKPRTLLCNAGIPSGNLDAAPDIALLPMALHTENQAFCSSHIVFVSV